jgi:Domain of unknown function (DUF5076)
MKTLEELDLPEDVVKADEAFEMLRFWIADQEDAVPMLVGTNGGNEPEMWGSILADISRHCVRAICAEMPDIDESEARARIEASYISRLKDKDSTSGSILSLGKSVQ